MRQKTNRRNLLPTWRILVRGESSVASTGLSLAAILLLLMSSTVWWNVRTYRRSQHAARTEQVHRAAELLVDPIETLLALDDLAAVRRLLGETARLHRLDECRLVLPGDRVVAHNDPTRTTLAALPETWTGRPSDPLPPRRDDERLSASQRLDIPGRGEARLDVTALPQGASAAYGQAQMGVGFVGALALVALLIVYRRMRSRVQAVTIIRDALRSVHDDEVSTESLMVPEHLGPEASAWNRLLQTNAQLRKQLVGRRVEQVLAVGPQAGGDLQGAFDVMPQGIILLGAGLKVTYANGAAAVYLRRTCESMIDATLGELVEDPGVLEAAEAVSSGSIRCWTTVEMEQVGEDASGVLRFSTRPLRHEDAGAAIVVIDDVTQQRVAEQSRNAFVAQVTHELRGPLTNVRLYAETAIDQGRADPEVLDRCLNVINTEAKRLERVVGDMLSISEIEAGQYEVNWDDLRLDTLFEELRHNYAGFAKDKDIALEFDLPPKLPIIQADRDKITLALHNVLGNAMKYTPEHGQVTVRVDTNDERLEVEVSDTGIGIKAEELDRIFDRFYRANDERLADITGSGLGLALAREVIRLHGGDIAVQSEHNKGSSFTLMLPTDRKAA